jgi:hypothetical protein
VTARTAHVRGARAVVALLVVLVSAGAFGSGVALAQESSEPAERTLELVSQTSWVGETGVFQVTVSTEGLPADAELWGRLYNRVTSRDELDETARGEGLGGKLFDVSAKPLAELALPGSGQATITVPVALEPSDDPALAWLPTVGVMPFVVHAVDAEGEEIASVVTHMIRLAAPEPTSTSATALSVGVAVPLSAHTTLDAEGAPTLDPVAAERLEGTIGATVSHAGVPLALFPSAESLHQLAAGSPTGAAAVDRLRPSSTRTVLAGPYAPIDTGAWTAADLDTQVDEQYAAGATTVRELLGDEPDGRIAVLDRTVSPEALSRILALGAESLVVPSGQLEPLSGSAADAVFAQRFLLDTGLEVDPPAVLADDPTAARLRPGGDPVLSGHLALAELAVLQLEQGSGTHGVAVVVPDDVDPSALTTFLAGLADTGGATSGSLGRPLVEPTSLAGLVEGIDDATTSTSGRRTTMTRGYVADAPADLGSYPEQLRDAGHAYEGLRTLVPTNPEVAAPVGQLVLASGSRHLDESGRESVLDAAATATSAITDEIVVAPQQVVTLTSSSGQVPLNLENRLSVPATVRIVMRSAKLDFPEGSVIERVLAPNTTTPVSLQVETRASGAFPLEVTITSADGAVPVTATEYTVRSTAISGIGLALSIGAGLFLLVWWARHFRTARRARQLVGADSDAPTLADAGGYAPSGADRTPEPPLPEGR